MRTPTPVLAYNLKTGKMHLFDGQTVAARWLVEQGLSKTVNTARANLVTATSRPGAFWGCLWVSPKKGEPNDMPALLEKVARKLRIRALSDMGWERISDERLANAIQSAGAADPAHTLLAR